jgi:hypothetical protein
MQVSNRPVKPVTHKKVSRKKLTQMSQVVIFFADQSFPPFLPADDSKCVAIIWVENGRFYEQKKNFRSGLLDPDPGITLSRVSTYFWGAAATTRGMRECLLASTPGTIKEETHIIAA